MLSARTVLYALEQLEEIGAVNENVYFDDTRRKLSNLTPATNAGIDLNPAISGD